MNENRSITVPKELETKLDQILTEMKIENSKTELLSSAFWPEKVERPLLPDGKEDVKAMLFVMYKVRINETLAFVAGMKVADLINKPI